MKQAKNSTLSIYKFEEDLIQKRKEELKHATDIRELYEKKLEKANNLYFELNSVLLQLDERERDLVKLEREFNIHHKRLVRPILKREFKIKSYASRQQQHQQQRQQPHYQQQKSLEQRIDQESRSTPHALVESSDQVQYARVVDETPRLAQNRTYNTSNTTETTNDNNNTNNNTNNNNNMKEPSENQRDAMVTYRAKKIDVGGDGDGDEQLVRVASNLNKYKSMSSPIINLSVGDDIGDMCGFDESALRAYTTATANGGGERRQSDTTSQSPADNSNASKSSSSRPKNRHRYRPNSSNSSSSNSNKTKLQLAINKSHSKSGGETAAGDSALSTKREKMMTMMSMANRRKSFSNCSFKSNGSFSKKYKKKFRKVLNQKVLVLLSNELCKILKIA